MIDLFAAARTMTADEAAEALAQLLSPEGIRLSHGKTWLHYTLVMTLISRIREVATQEWLESMGGRLVDQRYRPSVEEMQVQPMSEPRGLVFPPKITIH